MSTSYAIEVQPVSDSERDWRVVEQVTGRVLGAYSFKDTAVEAGRAVARFAGRELIIKNRDGTIAEKDSHGNDPSDVPG